MSVEEGSPGLTSPPKSGWSPRVEPMKLMKLALFESSGAVLTSTFHQLSGGKRGERAERSGCCRIWAEAEAASSRKTRLKRMLRMATLGRRLADMKILPGTFPYCRQRMLARTWRPLARLPSVLGSRRHHDPECSRSLPIDFKLYLVMFYGF